MKPITEISLSRKITIFSIIAAGVLFSLFFLALLPTIGAIRKSYGDFLAQKKSAEILLNAGSTASVIQSQAEGLKQSIARFNDSFLFPGREIDFIQFLEAAGRENNIKQTIQLNDPSLAKPDDFYPSALLVIKVNGSFLQFLRYLVDLERSPYYINVSSVTIHSGSSDSMAISEKPAQSKTAFTILNASEEAGLDAISNENETVKQSEREAAATIIGNVFWNYE